MKIKLPNFTQQEFMEDTLRSNVDNRIRYNNCHALSNLYVRLKETQTYLNDVGCIPDEQLERITTEYTNALEQYTDECIQNLDFNQVAQMRSVVKQLIKELTHIYNRCYIIKEE